MYSTYAVLDVQVVNKGTRAYNVNLTLFILKGHIIKVIK